jgi:hypothetical protein
VLELLDTIVEETVVKVLATQVSVADGGFDLKDTVLNSQEEHVEDSSEIKDEYIALAGDILGEAMAAAVGSLKYAGTVITALLQVVPRYDSAVSFSPPRRPYMRFPQATR